MKWIARALVICLLIVYVYVMAWMAGAAWQILSDAFIAGRDAVRWL